MFFSDYSKRKIYSFTNFVGLQGGKIYKNIKGKYLFKLPKSESNSIIKLLNNSHFISSHKKLDYEIWKEIIIIINNKQHLTSEGYTNKVGNLKSQMHYYTKLI